MGLSIIRYTLENFYAVRGLLGLPPSLIITNNKLNMSGIQFSVFDSNFIVFHGAEDCRPSLSGSSCAKGVKVVNGNASIKTERNSCQFIINFIV